jgi:hypothetical protein
MADTVEEERRAAVLRAVVPRAMAADAWDADDGGDAAPESWEQTAACEESFGGEDSDGEVAGAASVFAGMGIEDITQLASGAEGLDVGAGEHELGEGESYPLHPHARESDHCHVASSRPAGSAAEQWSAPRHAGGELLGRRRGAFRRAGRGDGGGRGAQGGRWWC